MSARFYKMVLLSSMILTSTSCKKMLGSANNAEFLKELSAASEINPLLEVSIEDYNCQESEKSLSLKTQKVWGAKNGTIVSTNENLSFATSHGDSGLSSKAVNSVIFGFKQVTSQSCIDMNSKWTCQVTESVIIDEGKSLKLCNANGNYARNSYEGIAVSSLLTLESAYNFFVSAVPEVQAPQQVITMVHPRIDYFSKATQGKIQENRLNHSADNAAYTQLKIDGKKQGTIFLYPSSMDFVKKTKNSLLGMWEVPFIVAHEYGHHLFAEIAPSTNSFYSSYAFEEETREEIEKELTEKFPPQSMPRLGAAPGSTTVRKIDDIISIFSEAYADFFAGMLTREPNSMSLIPLVCGNRDFTSPSFKFNGIAQKKEMNKKVFDIFFGYSKPSSLLRDSANCLSVAYDDPHVLGTIIAYSLNALSIATSNNQQKLHTASMWVKSLEKIFNRGEDAESLFIQGIEAIGATFAMENANKKLTSDQCNIFKNAFPIMTNKESLNNLGCS